MTTVPATVQERFSVPGPMNRPRQQSTGFGLADVMRIIKQRFFLIFFVWLLMIGLTIGGTALAARYFPLYEASALLMVEQSGSAGTDPLERNQLAQTNDAVLRFLKDQAAFIKSQTVLEHALLDAGVKNSQWYRDIDEADKRIKYLSEQLVVVPLEGTSLLQIMIRTKSQNDPHRIVNAVCSSYLVLTEEHNRSAYRDRIEAQSKEADAAKQEVTAKLDEIQRFIDEINQPGVVVGYNFLATRIQELSEVLAQLRAQKEQYAALWESYNQVRPGELAISPQMRQLVESDPQVLQLAAQQRAFEQERRLQLEKFGESHRYVTEINNRLEDIENELTRLRDTRLLEIQRYQRDQAQLAYLNAQNTELSMNETYEDLLAQQRDLDRQIARYQTLQTELKILEDRSQEVQRFLNDLKEYVAQKSTINVRRYADAAPPLERFFPNWLIMVPAGTVLGLGIAVGLAFLVELVNTRVRTPVDLTRHVNLPVLGTVPDVDDEEVDIEVIEKAVLEKPRSMMAEAFKTIRTNLFFSAPAERQRSMMITSSQPEDGKTTIATNLAATIAQSARRVLLIDANFRRPALGRVYESANGAGLSNVLIGQKSLEDVVIKTSLPNLDVVTSGPIPPNPVELLGSDQMRQLIDHARQHYDQVIFDSPPVLLVSDALVLSSMVDGVILVVRAQVNSRGVVNRARELLERVNAHVFGATLNAAQSRRGGYFREQFRTFYDYQPEAPGLEADERTLLPPGDSSRNDANDSDGNDDADES